MSFPSPLSILDTFLEGNFEENNSIFTFVPSSPTYVPPSCQLSDPRSKSALKPILKSALIGALNLPLYMDTFTFKTDLGGILGGSLRTRLVLDPRLQLTSSTNINSLSLNW